MYLIWMPHDCVRLFVTQNINYTKAASQNIWMELLSMILLCTKFKKCPVCVWHYFPAYDSWVMTNLVLTVMYTLSLVLDIHIIQQ